MKRIALTLAALPLAACIWTPTNRTDQESTAPIALSGYAPFSGAPVTLEALNLTTGIVDVVGTTTTGTTASFYGPDPFYPWSTTITPAADYWSPQTVTVNGSALNLFGLATSTGRLEITGHSTYGTFYTFSAAAETCTGQKINSGSTIEAAAEACSDGMSLVVFDNDGVGSNAPPSTWSTGWTTDCCTGSTTCNNSAPHCNYTGPDYTPPGVLWEIGHYTVENNMSIYGALCRPSTSGTHKAMIINHSGYGGIEDAALNACISFASQGWVTAVSAFRGEAVTLAGVPPNGHVSSGTIEVCLGEVKDSMQLTKLVRSRSDVDTSRVLMWGHSHGACITERALENGVQVQAAAAISAPTDHYAWWEYCSAGGVGSPPSPPSVCYTNGAALSPPLYNQHNIEYAYGRLASQPNGLSQTYVTPDQSRVPYDWRSPVHFAADLAARTDVKILLMQGGSDWLVEPSQACALAGAAGWASSTTSEIWHIDDKNYPAVMPPQQPHLSYQAPIGLDANYDTSCAPYSLTWTPNPLPFGSWTGKQYLLVFEAEDHDSIITNPAPWATFQDWVSSVLP
jgi:hypothetical protein